MALTFLPGELDGEGRMASADAVIARARSTIRDWVATRTDPALPVEKLAVFARFHRHFGVLDDVFGDMLDAIQADLHTLPGSPGVGVMYERSRSAEQRVGKVRAAFRWYAHKYEQREDGPDGYGPVLLAADEIVRSCWDVPFERSGGPRPTAPLCYLDERYDAFAIPRRSPPGDLPAGDAVVGTFVTSMPVPMIALPLTCVEQPWWLALVPHEVGHHIQFDLHASLEAGTEEVIADAVRRVDPGLEAAWRRWSNEIFADAWAVLMVGGAAGWVVSQLVVAEPSAFVGPIGYRETHPPGLVRLALLGELGTLLGVEAPGLTAAEVKAVLASSAFADVDGYLRAEYERHLDVVPAVAAAVLDTPTDGTVVRELSGWADGLLGADGTASTWSQALLDPNPLISRRQERWSARTLAAAAVTAARAIPPGEDRQRLLDELGGRVLDLLPTFGPEGDLAEEDVLVVPEAQRKELARQFTETLFAEVP